MKRFAFTLIIGIAALVLNACEDALTDAESTPQLSVAGEQTTPSGGFQFPEGTSVSEQTDESGQRFIHFELPESHRLIGRVDPSFPDLGGQVMKTTGGDITCECTEGSGNCNPFNAHGPDGDVWGCAMEPGCTTCVGTRSVVMPVDGEQARVPFEETAIVNLETGIRVVVEEKELEDITCASSVLFRDPEILEHLQRFVGRYQIHNVEEARAARSREELPDNYLMAPLNVYGNLVWVPVERSASLSVTMSQLVWEAARTPGGGSCSCSSGNGSCQYYRESIPFIGYAEWCESDGCSACTLHG